MWCPSSGSTTGETMAKMKVHYATLGTPKRDAQGQRDQRDPAAARYRRQRARHGLRRFGSKVFGPGQVFDITRYFIVLPDAIGHGGTAKPSDGLKAALSRNTTISTWSTRSTRLAEHLGIQRFELVGGQSMGCMHSFDLGDDLSRAR